MWWMFVAGFVSGLLIGGFVVLVLWSSWAAQMWEGWW